MKSTKIVISKLTSDIFNAKSSITSFAQYITDDPYMARHSYKVVNASALLIEASAILESIEANLDFEDIIGETIQGLNRSIRGMARKSVGNSELELARMAYLVELVDFMETGR